MTSGLFVDVLNLHYCVGMKYNNGKLDYAAYLQNLNNFADRIGELKWKVAYGTQKYDEANKFINRLRYLGFDIRYINLLKNRIITTRVDFVIDVVKLVPRLDTIILGVNNLDYIPLIQWVRNQGVKCGIYAARISKELKEECDFYIEIDNNLLIKQQQSDHNQQSDNGVEESNEITNSTK